MLFALSSTINWAHLDSDLCYSDTLPVFISPGALSEDPNFPKIQWPSPEMCAACHTVETNGDHKWIKKQVLSFLLSYFSSDRILTGSQRLSVDYICPSFILYNTQIVQSFEELTYCVVSFSLPDYLEDESQVLEKQREKHDSWQKALEAQKTIERKVREASDSMMHPLASQSTVQEEDEGEEPEDETVADEEEEAGEEAAAADEIGGKTSEPTPWGKPEMELVQGPWRPHRKPSIVGMRMREVQEDIVDLDSFVNQHYKAKALQVAASSRVKQRTLQRKEEQEPGPVFGLGMELDTGLGMVGLQPMETNFEQDVGQRRKRLQKRELSGQAFGDELNHRGRWVSVLTIGFSKVDISLCVILYVLSSMCLLAMYLFFKTRFRLRRGKAILP